MKQQVKIGQTDYTVLILIRDKDGAPKTGLTFESAGIDVCYTRVETDNDVVLTAGAPVTTTLTGNHVDWGFVKVDDTNAPGLYKLDIADGVFASGAWSAVVSLICTGCDPVHIEFVLVPEAPIDGVKINSIAANAITATAINADAITNAKIADDAIAVENIKDAAITAAKIATDAIDDDAVAANVTAVIAAAVWNAETASYGGAGTYGQAVEDALADTNEMQGDLVNGGRLDLLIDGIKAKTDSLTFTVGNQVDANIQYINDTAVTGDGDATPWGPV